MIIEVIFRASGMRAALKSSMDGEIRERKKLEKIVCERENERQKIVERASALLHNMAKQRVTPWQQ